ncbi:MAG: TRAP transporter TatT component family protein [Myxococcota bacterium]
MRNALWMLLVAMLASGCIKKIAINSMADALSGSTGGTFTQDDDLQFVGEALPFALKTMEAINDSAPKHVGIKETLCSGMTQYAMVYVKWPADQVRYDDFGTYEAGIERTKKFLDRSETFCLSALDLKHEGFSDRVFTDTDAVLAEMEEDDVLLLYWTGATWLARISISKDDMEAIGQLPFAQALLERALELDEDWSKGSLHDMMILLEPNTPMPGGLDRAREHYTRALELSGGSLASPYVSLATSVSYSNQDKDEFVELMEKALEIDPAASPEDQLANLYAQAQARFYLDHLDDLFVE